MKTLVAAFHMADEGEECAAQARALRLFEDRLELEAQVDAYKAHLTASYALIRERDATLRLKLASKQKFGFGSHSSMHAPMGPTIEAFMTQSTPLLCCWVLFPHDGDEPSSLTPALSRPRPASPNTANSTSAGKSSRFDLAAPPPITSSTQQAAAPVGVELSVASEMHSAGPLVAEFCTEVAVFAHLRGLRAHCIMLPQRIQAGLEYIDQPTDDVALRRVVCAAAKAGCYLFVGGVERATQAALRAVGQAMISLSIISTRPTFRLLLGFRGDVNDVSCFGFSECMRSQCVVGSVSSGRVALWSTLCEEVQAARFLSAYDDNDASDARARRAWAEVFAGAKGGGGGKDGVGGEGITVDYSVGERLGRVTAVLGAVSDRSDAARALYIAPSWSTPQVFRRGQPRPLGWAVGQHSVFAGWPSCPGIPQVSLVPLEAVQDEGEGVTGGTDGVHVEVPDPAQPARRVMDTLAGKSTLPDGEGGRREGGRDGGVGGGEWVDDDELHPLAALERALDVLAVSHSTTVPPPDVPSAASTLASHPLLRNMRLAMHVDADEVGLYDTDMAAHFVCPAPRRATRTPLPSPDPPSTLFKTAPVESGIYAVDGTSTAVVDKLLGAEEEEEGVLPGVPLAVVRRGLRGYHVVHAKSRTRAAAVDADSSVYDDICGVDSRVEVGVVGGSSSDDECDTVAALASSSGLVGGLVSMSDGRPPPYVNSSLCSEAGAAAVAAKVGLYADGCGEEGVVDWGLGVEERMMRVQELGAGVEMTREEKMELIRGAVRSVAARRDLLRRRRRAFRSYVRDGEYWRTQPALTGQLAPVVVSEVLRQINTCACLQSLSVVGQRIAADDLEWLLHGLGGGGVPVRVLALVGTQLSDVDCARVVRVLVCARRTLESLDLSNNAASSQTLFALGMPPSIEPMETQLSLLRDAAEVSDAQLNELMQPTAADAAAGTSVSDEHRDDDGDAAIDDVVAAVQRSTQRALREQAVQRAVYSETDRVSLLARQLRLDGCFLSTPTFASVQAFGASLHARPFDSRGGLVALAMSSAQWPTRAGLYFLREILPRCKALSRLSLSGFIARSDLPAVALAPALSPRYMGQSLVRLSLRSCGLSAVSVVLLSSAVRSTRALESVDLSDNPDLFVSACGATDAVEAACDSTAQRFADFYQRIVAGEGGGEGSGDGGAKGTQGRRHSAASSTPSLAAVAAGSMGNSSMVTRLLNGSAHSRPSLAASIGAAQAAGFISQPDVPYFETIERLVDTMHAAVPFSLHIAPAVVIRTAFAGSSSAAGSHGLPTAAAVASPRDAERSSTTTQHARRSSEEDPFVIPPHHPSGAAHAVGPLEGVDSQYQPSTLWERSSGSSAAPVGLAAMAATDAVVMGRRASRTAASSRKVGDGFVVSRVAIANLLGAAISERQTVRSLRVCNTGLDDASAACLLAGCRGVKMLDVSSNALGGTSSGCADADDDWAEMASETYRLVTAVVSEATEMLGAVAKGAAFEVNVDAAAAARRSAAVAAASAAALASLAGSANVASGYQASAAAGSAKRGDAFSIDPLAGSSAMRKGCDVKWVPAGALFGKILRDPSCAVEDLRIRSTTPAFARDIAYVLRWTSLKCVDMRGNLSSAAAVAGVDAAAAAVGVPRHLATELDLEGDAACLRRIADAVELKKGLAVLW